MKKVQRIFNKGFSLIELLVVVSILGLLSVLVISNVSGIRERARDSQRKAELRQIKLALRIYKNDFGAYPTGSSGNIVGCGTVAAVAACTWGGEFKRGDSTYMKVLPKDPSWTATSNVLYSYSRPANDIDSFILYAVLENKSDQEIGKSQTNCKITGQENTTKYYVCAD